MQPQMFNEVVKSWCRKQHCHIDDEFLSQERPRSCKKTVASYTNSFEHSRPPHQQPTSSSSSSSTNFIATQVLKQNFQIVVTVA